MWWVGGQAAHAFPAGALCCFLGNVVLLGSMSAVVVWFLLESMLSVGD